MTRPFPGPAKDNNERILERGYEDFARLPDDEVHPVGEPGAGPSGTVSSGPLNVGLILLVAAFAVSFLAFAVVHWWPLIVAAVLVVAGLATGAVRSRQAAGRGRASSPM